MQKRFFSEGNEGWSEGGKTKRRSGVKKHDRAPREGSASHQEANALRRLLLVKTPEVTPRPHSRGTPACTLSWRGTHSASLQTLRLKPRLCIWIRAQGALSQGTREHLEMGFSTRAAAPRRRVTVSTAKGKDAPSLSWAEAGAQLSTCSAQGSSP